MVDSDHDSSCSSSLTVLDSSHISSRRSSISISSLYETSSVINSQKPHKQNQAAWEAMKSLRDQKGRVALDHFRLLRRLGSGDLGNVYLCQLRRSMNMNDLNNNTVLPNRESTSLYAMKVVDREALAIRKKLGRAETEREILGMLDHPFLPTLYAEFDASHYSCLVMEFCPGGDLYAARQRQIGKRFSISSSRFYAAETLLALEYLHMMGIVYRDLKPENVLIRSDGHIMLSDFDLSLRCDVVPKLIRSNKPETNEKTVCYIPSCATPLQSCFSSQNTKFKKCTTSVKTITTHVDDQVDQDGVINNGDPEMVAEPINARSKSFVGTHEYLAPEVISGQGHGAAVDWWTLGVFLYELIYGKTPFKGENNEKTLVNILKQPLTFPKFGVSSSKEFEEVVKVQDLISKLLVKNPKKRIGGLKGSVEIKRHEFFKGVNWALIRSVKPPDVPLNDHKVRGNVGNLVPKLSRKERDAPFQNFHHFDYF